MKSYFVYILTNRYNTVLYIGVTNDLQKRVWEHKNKLVDGFSKKYNLTKLVYFEEFANVEEAIAAEKKLKGWVRRKKDLLISSSNPSWRDLSLSFWTHSIDSK